MFDVKKAEKERKKILLRGMEKLMEQGGFIKETIEQELESLFGSDVMETVNKYCENGEGFWEVAEEIERVYAREPDCGDCGLDEYGEPIRLGKDEYTKWCVDHTARIAAERVRAGTEQVWSDWDLSLRIKRILEDLTALEERILYLRFGLDGHGVRELEQIANMPEFSCDVNYIEKAFKRVPIRLRRAGHGYEKFAEACSLYREKNMNENN